MKRKEGVRLWPLNTPVLFLVFNRPAVTDEVFKVIRQVEPRQLFVAADGPRREYPAEVQKCRKVREIATDVDWDCEVKTLFRDQHLGCQVAVSSAINWFFDNVEEGIILEDDCIPNQSFFRFCQELLKYYRDDQRIFVISGNNFQRGRKRTEYSYYFSCFNHCWGWATWKRAWRYFDFNMKFWPTVREGRWMRHIWPNYTHRAYWEDIFETVYRGNVNSWAYRWTFACWLNNGLSILPTVNLVSNIGFGEYATHTKDRSHSAFIPAKSMRFPLKHPPFMIRDNQADDFTQRRHFGATLVNLLKGKVARFYRQITGKKCDG